MNIPVEPTNTMGKQKVITISTEGNETYEFERPDVANLEYLDVTFLKATGTNVLQCLQCAGIVAGPHELDRHARVHFMNNSLNAEFCRVCNKDAGVGESSIRAHKAGNLHKKVNRNKKQEYCRVHLQPAHSQCKSTPFEQISDSYGIECVTEEEATPTETREARQRVDRSVTPDTHSVATILGFACSTGHKDPDDERSLLSAPICDVCAAVQKMNPGVYSQGLTIKDVKEPCSLCQRREALFGGVFVPSGAKCRTYSVHLRLLERAYPVKRSEVPAPAEELESAVWVTLPDDQKAMYDTSMRGSKVVMRLKPGQWTKKVIKAIPDEKPIGRDSAVKNSKSDAKPPPAAAAPTPKIVVPVQRPKAVDAQDKAHARGHAKPQPRTETKTAMKSTSKKSTST